MRNLYQIWNLDTKTQVHLLNAHHAQIYSVDFNGKYVCSGSLDADVRVWDAATGRCLYTLEGHDALVGHVQIYGDLLATAGSDGRVCIVSCFMLKKLDLKSKK
jgi:F-box and WD-40 domain protein CDC4